MHYVVYEQNNIPDPEAIPYSKINNFNSDKFK